ncbi:MAG: helix-turn-helix transcriptional regulator [Verrucomicrobium sp.]|nr:helix-turn-helix transcriptional regulator [Verrucomicrobium sp.]
MSPSSFAIQSEVVVTRRSGQVPSRVEALEIIRMARGHALWAVEGEPVEVKEHDVIFVLPGQLFSGIESSESVPVRAERIVIRLSQAKGAGAAAALASALGVDAAHAEMILAALQNASPPKVNVGQEGARLCGELVRNPDPQSRMERSYLSACVFKLLCRICLCLEGKALGGGTLAGSEQRVVAFLQELESRSSEPWTLETMAHETGLKRSRFGTICRQLTGENPITFLSRLRVRASRKLLRESGMSITDIAMECGFGSSQYFSKIFRRYQGHEPTHFRQLSAETRQGRGIHYLKGDSARTVAHAEMRVEVGDFTVECRITLDRLGGTAASLELGPDRFGFDGRQGCLFCEGGNFGSARFFDPTHRHIREGVPFDFKVERLGSRITFAVNGTQVATLPDASSRVVGLVGLRPLRNGISIHSFRVNGQEVALKSVLVGEG